jgi:alginate O-acetyltransferase complex protein AlgI
MFFFLPIVLTIYFLLRKRSHRNHFFTLASLVFYAWAERWFVVIMLVSIVFNWIFGRKIDENKAAGRAKPWLVAAIVMNLGLLGTYKYLNFLVGSLNAAAGLHIPLPELALPIGISFFTFQALSYVIDVYRGAGPVQKGFWNVCLYISSFPQHIAGPIVRYETVSKEIDGRVETLDGFIEGSRRFMVGLAKKTILADALALVATSAFSQQTGELSVGAAWLGAIGYLWQVYYDFSGYSDMAIGVGMMFGFHFPENFIYPMISRSITEFWRRWHISLGTWFRDYLYFPLGGSRVKSVWRMLFNMFVVWSLTGLWHGASWSYFLWGVGFFVLLAFERMTGLAKKLDKQPLGVVYAMVAVITITVMIRSSGLGLAYGMRYIGVMYGFHAHAFWDATATMIVKEYGPFIVAALLLGLPVGGFLKEKLHIPARAFEIASAVGLVAVFALSVTYVMMGGYNPFIYAKF